MDLLDPRNQRHTTFQKTQSEGQNLYTKIYEMLIKKQYTKAEELLGEHFSRDPFSGEAMLSWAELMLYQGEPEIAIYKIGELLRDFPRTPITGWLRHCSLRKQLRGMKNFLNWIW